MNPTLLLNLKKVLVSLSILLAQLTGASHAPLFGTATVTAGNNYPTSSYSFSDNDIINAGDLNLISTYTGTRTATDTVSLQGQIYNVSSTANNPPLATATGTLATANGGIGTSTTPTDSQILTANGSTPQWRKLSAGSGLSLSTSTTALTLSFTGSQSAVFIPVYAAQSINIGQAVSISGDWNNTAIATSGAALGVGFVTVNGDVAQKQAVSFVLPVSTTISTVTVPIDKIGTPVDSMMVDVQSNSAGAPSGTVLASSTIASGTITTSNAFTSLSFFSSTTLSASTTYWLVFERTGSNSDSNAYHVGGGSTTTIAQICLNACSAKAYNGSNWTSQIPNLTPIFNMNTGQTEVQLASAAVSSTTNLFLGFIDATSSFLGSANTYINGIVTVPRATGNTLYYLGNAGALSTTAGATTRKVGVGIGASQLLITNLW